MQATKYASNGSSLALKPRGHVTRSPRQTQKGLMSFQIFFGNKDSFQDDAY